MCEREALSGSSFLRSAAAAVASATTFITNVLLLTFLVAAGVGCDNSTIAGATSVVAVHKLPCTPHNHHGHCNEEMQ